MSGTSSSADPNPFSFDGAAAFSVGTTAATEDASGNPFATAASLTAALPTASSFSFTAPAASPFASPARSATAAAPSTSAEAAASPSFLAPAEFVFGAPASSAPSGPSSKDFNKPMTREEATRVVREGQKREAEERKKLAAKSGSTAAAAAATAAPSTPPPFPPPPVSIDLTRQYAVLGSVEQRVLDLVAQGCASTFLDPNYSAVLARIKHFFFHRQFEKVFDDPRHLGVYVAQYLPMRALCYTALWSTHPLLKALLSKEVVIYAIGAGPGSEAVGVTMAREVIIRERIRAGAMTLAQVVAPPKPGAARFRVHSQDLFDWTSSLQPLLGALAIHAPLSYTSTNYTFSRSNVLDADLSMTQFKNSHIVTMMFVLNELFQGRGGDVRVMRCAQCCC